MIQEKSAGRAEGRVPGPGWSLGCAPPRWVLGFTREESERATVTQTRARDSAACHSEGARREGGGRWFSWAQAPPLLTGGSLFQPLWGRVRNWATAHLVTFYGQPWTRSAPMGVSLAMLIITVSI